MVPIFPLWMQYCELYELPEWCRSAGDPSETALPTMQQHALSTSTACLAPTDCSVLLSALHGELHPDLHTCDGSKYVGSAHASVIPMFCGSVTGGALCPCVCERHPGVFGCKVSPARRSKWRVFFFWPRWTFGQLAELSRSSQRLPGTSSFVDKLGYWPGWSPLTRMQPHAHATISVDVAALSVQVRLQ